MKNSPEVIIYSLEGCPYSSKSVNLVKKNFETYVIKYISRDKKQEYKRKNNHPTFPQVFIGGKLIGGCDEFEKYIELRKTNLKKIPQFVLL